MKRKGSVEHRRIRHRMGAYKSFTANGLETSLEVCLGQGKATSASEFPTEEFRLAAEK